MHTDPHLARQMHEERAERLRRDAPSRDPGGARRALAWRLSWSRRAFGGRPAVASC